MSRVAAMTTGCIVKTSLAHESGEKELPEAIETIFKDHNERSGSFRIHQELRGQGFAIGRKRVARIMKKKGLHAE